MSTTWRKVFGDLKDAPSRMALLGLAVFVGTLAMGTAFGVRTILTREVQASYAGSIPPSAVLWLDHIDEDVLAETKRQAGVQAAEPWRLVRLRVEVAPGEWRPFRLFAVQDFNAVRVSKFTAVSGDWPPREGEILVERSALPVLRADQGMQVRLRLPGGPRVDLPISGIVHDPGQAPGWMDQVAYGYCTIDTMRSLNLGSEFDELRIVTTGDREQASEIASALAGYLRDRGRVVHRVEVPLREHPHADHMASMLFVLQVFSVLALLMSGALAANVLAALLAKQTRQIGVMKTIGATSFQVAVVYLRLILLLVSVAVAVALLIADWIAGKAAAMFAEHLNLSVSNLSLPWWLVPTLAIVAIAVPLLATVLVVWRATRMTARDAVLHHGLLPPAGSQQMAWLLGGWASNRILALSLRNTFRRPRRLASTVGTLALGGAMILTTTNLYESLNAGLDTTLAEQGHNIDVRLLTPAPKKLVIEKVAEIKGVEHVEAWGMVLAALESAEARDSNSRVSTGRYTVFAPPSDTHFLKLRLVAGRWLQADETDVVVANRTLADKEPLIRNGGNVTLLAEGRRRTVKVVGIVEEIAPPTIYTTGATFVALTGQPNQAAALRIKTAAESEQSVASELEDVLADSGWMPSLVMTREEFRTSLLDHFLIILICLLAAGASAVVVGSMSVVTSMGINVIQRSREIGIARAMGATQLTLLQMVIMEGIALMVLSISVGVILAIPASVILTVLIGDIGPHVTLPFVMSTAAIIGWVVVAAAVTFIACWLAARRALALPVQQVLTFE